MPHSLIHAIPWSHEVLSFGKLANDALRRKDGDIENVGYSYGFEKPEHAFKTRLGQPNRDVDKPCMHALMHPPIPSSVHMRLGRGGLAMWDTLAHLMPPHHAAVVLVWIAGVVCCFPHPQNLIAGFAMRTLGLFKCKDLGRRWDLFSSGYRARTSNSAPVQASPSVKAYVEREAGDGVSSWDDVFELRRTEMETGERIPFEELPASISSLLEASQYNAQYWAQPPAQPAHESPLAAAASIMASRGCHAANASMKSLKETYSLPHIPHCLEGGREALDELAKNVLKRRRKSDETLGKYWGSALARASDSQRQAFDTEYSALKIKQSIVDGGAVLPHSNARHRLPAHALSSGPPPLPSFLAALVVNNHGRL